MQTYSLGHENRVSVICTYYTLGLTCPVMRDEKKINNLRKHLRSDDIKRRQTCLEKIKRTILHVPTSISA